MADDIKRLHYFDHQFLREHRTSPTSRSITWECGGATSGCSTPGASPRGSA